MYIIKIIKHNLFQERRTPLIRGVLRFFFGSQAWQLAADGNRKTKTSGFEIP